MFSHKLNQTNNLVSTGPIDYMVSVNYPSIDLQSACMSIPKTSLTHLHFDQLLMHCYKKCIMLLVKLLAEFLWIKVQAV